MSRHQVVVRGGRIVMDEPTEFPDGTVLEFVEVDPHAHFDDADELDGEERAKLHAAIDRGAAEIQAGKGIPAEQFIEELDEP